MTTGLAILGSTGSIGRQTLEVVHNLRRRFRIVGLAAGHNVTLLEEQARELSPSLLWADREGDYLRQKAPALRARWTPMEEMACHPDVDIVVVATPGKAGLLPTLAAVRAGKVVALANKEVLVMAGHLVVAAARQHGADLRPIDSEHSAIWQCLWGEDRAGIARIILTGSGGPFRDLCQEDLDRVTAEEALRHPTWQMGHKVTVDSATLLNKGLEAIEAHWLFGVPFDKIEVVLHRESIVHSLVEFRDGSIKAQLGMPDMRLPIQCALTYPQRLPVRRKGQAAGPRPTRDAGLLPTGAATLPLPGPGPGGRPQRRHLPHRHGRRRRGGGRALPGRPHRLYGHPAGYRVDPRRPPGDGRSPAWRKCWPPTPGPAAGPRTG